MEFVAFAGKSGVIVDQLRFICQPCTKMLFPEWVNKVKGLLFSQGILIADLPADLAVLTMLYIGGPQLLIWTNELEK